MLVVTTAHNVTAAQHARAQRVSAALGVPLVERHNRLTTGTEHGATMLYVVRIGRDELVDVATGAGTHVQPGMLTIKRGQGRDHPFVRAVCGGAIDKPDTIFDGTLGLLNDALHLAVVLGCGVVGCEHSAVMQCLLDEGLQRLQRDADVDVADAARRIVMHKTDAMTALAARADHSIDVVTLDPMMSQPKKASPAFSMLRVVAHHAPADRALLIEARRVARSRVVLKLGKGAPLPADCGDLFTSFEEGKHVIYHVVESASPA
jgi:16S rRNA (guanine1516-N2)-methyltransferase